METENIDLFDILEKLWRRKKVIFAWIGGCLVVGVALVFLLPRQYKAECMMQWKLSDGSCQIAPSLYPDLFYSDAFMRELSRRVPEVSADGDTLTSDRLRKELFIALNMNENYLTVGAETGHPKQAALLAEQARLLLEEYIREEGSKKMRVELDAVEKRYLKMKDELQHRRQQLVESLEKTASLSPVRREVEKKILQEDYDLFYSLYSDCVGEYEKTRIRCQDDSLVLTVIKPVAEPSVPSKPRPRLLLAAALFLGILLGCGWALLMPERRR